MLAPARVIHIAAAALVAFVATPSNSGAQDAAARPDRWEFLSSSGKLVPTGAQRSAIETGDHTAAQLTRVVTPHVAVTSSIGWTRTHRVAEAGAPYLNVFMADIGAELRVPRTATPDGWSAQPFIGAGTGVRNYSARHVAESARYGAASYVSAGGELGMRRFRVRVEARDYVSAFRELDGRGGSAARNDVAVMIGLRLVSQ